MIIPVAPVQVYSDMILFDAIVKPTLLLDKAVCRRNILRMAAKARASEVVFRPHFKTHQSIEVGEWFRVEGVRQITVSSLDMAEYFASAGWEDILLAFTLNLRQLEGINQLARRTLLGVLVESVESVQRVGEALTAPVNVWIKVDAGGGRTGIPWHRFEDIEAVSAAIRRFPLLHLSGLLTHSGNSYSAGSSDEAARLCQAGITRLDGIRCQLGSRETGPLLVSIGDTPGCSVLDDFKPADEIRPGNFAFYDAQQVQIGVCGWEDIAVALACPVVALHPERGEAVIYGGAIHLSKDYFEVGGVRQYGLVCLPEGNHWGPPLQAGCVARLSQEHGILRLDPSDLARIRVGELVCILPAHSCLTVQAMGRYLTLEGEWVRTMLV
jgi:D-serine deaminase-like pyridoxal phosphate-dependent protein